MLYFFKNFIEIRSRWKIIVDRIKDVFGKHYRVDNVSVEKRDYGYECNFTLDGDKENGVYQRGWFTWTSNGNIKLRLTKPLWLGDLNDHRQCTNNSYRIC